jgi:hypothetical protein
MSETSMVERVARAMCIADGHDPDADWRKQDSGVMLSVADPTPEWWRRYTRKAKVAIKAMREPTAAMQDVGMERVGYYQFDPAA